MVKSVTAESPEDHIKLTMLDTVESALVYTTITFDVFNILLCSASFFFYNKKIFPHFNIKSLVVLWFLGSLIQHIGQLMFVITIWNERRLLLTQTMEVGTIGRILTFFGVFSNRIVLFLIGMERMIATIQLDSYEKRQITPFSCLLTVTWLLGALILDYIYFLTKHISYAYITMVLSIDLIAALTSIIIRLWNNRLNKTRQILNLSLTQRYQLTENLRLLKAQFPLVFAAHIASLISVTVTFCMNFNFPFTRYHSLLFHALNAVFSTLYMFFSIFIFKSVLTPLIPKKWGCFRKKANIHRISSSTTIDEKTKHFQMLQYAWN